MDEFRIISPTGILGYGFPVASFERGMAAAPHAIAVDAGSTDPGPAYLGAGKNFVDDGAVRRDLDILLAAALGAGIPLLIGTAGGSGAKPHVDGCLRIIESVLKAQGRSARVAVVYSDVHKRTVLSAMKRGRVRPLKFAPELTEETVRKTRRIVAQVGVEPVLAALEEPVDVVVVGRCYDPAVFAAPALRLGFAPGPALHMGKVLECAAIAATPGSGRDCVLGTLKGGGFVLDTLNPERRFTTESVAAHTMYEKSHPYILPGPGGHLDLSGCRFKQVSHTAVEVSGSRFVPEERPTLKLEGAALAGYRTICVAGARDPILVERLDEVYEGVRAAVRDNFGDKPHSLRFLTYGRDGVMGELEPLRGAPVHEVGVVFDVVAPTQGEADTICGFARATALHYGYKGRMATAGNLAFPFSPSDIQCGPVYEFTLCHLMEAENPGAIFPVKRLVVCP